MKPEILFEDDAVIVCRKPSGIAVQTASLSAGDMVSILKNHIARQAAKNGMPLTSEPYLAVIHRLDQPVEGLLVFAKNKKAAASLSAQLQKYHFGKYYKALAEGNGAFLQEGRTLCDHLVKDARTNLSRVCTPDTPGAKEAVLTCRLLAKKEENDSCLSLLEIHLKTGRHHQIRVQLSHAGLPILGDRKYNPDGRPYKSLALCACRLSFRHPETGKQMDFEIEPSFPY